MSDEARRRESTGRRKVGAEETAFIELLRTANLLNQGVVEVLRPAGLTPTQYNVLRILAGAEGPLNCGEVAARMIARDPDVTRLLDRMEKQGLIVRSRSTEDRRVVVTEITGQGRTLVDELAEPVDRIHREQLGHLGEDRLRALASLLGEAVSKLR